MWQILSDFSRIQEESSGSTAEEILDIVNEELKDISVKCQNEEDMNELEQMQYEAAVIRLVTKLRPLLHRRVCVTAAGYFGVVPSGTHIGDEVCIIAGAPCPYVLRKINPPKSSTSSHESHELVGACFITGMMHGELQNRVLQSETITLC